MPSKTPQAKFWILTIPQHEFIPHLPKPCCWIKGQLEQGAGGFVHWQVCVCFTKKVRLGSVRDLFGTAHAEPTRSAAAMEYVHKDDTAIVETRFELGVLPRQRTAADWDEIRDLARAGRLDAIPADIYVRCYNSLKRIAKDHLVPLPMERTVYVFWGTTGTGKSRRAWDEATNSAFPKDPRTKFWDGYDGHEHVVIDEFRGGIDISHLLRWCDRYPVIVEEKGGSRVFNAKTIWITSNLDPRRWFPEADQAVLDALMRRLKITHMG